MKFALSFSFFLSFFHSRALSFFNNNNKRNESTSNKYNTLTQHIWNEIIVTKASYNKETD